MNKKILSSLAAAVATAAMAGVSAMNAFAETEAAGAANSQGTGQMSAGAGMGGTLIMMVAMFAILYFVAIRPQKKRDRELKEMQQSLQVGDEIVTGGGIVGIVVSVGEDTVVIETGGAKHKLRIKNWAITENVTAMERMKEAKASGAKKSPALETAAVVDDTSEEKKSKKKKDDEE